MEDKAVVKRLETIERLLRDILKEKKVTKETWVKVGVVKELTGWDCAGIRRARRNNAVKVKKEGVKGLWYSLESIPEKFIKKTA